jgi:hypothetical protein
MTRARFIAVPSRPRFEVTRVFAGSAPAARLALRFALVPAR